MRANIEAFHESVSPWLTGRDGVHLPSLAPCKEGAADQLGAVIAHTAERAASTYYHRVQFVGYPEARQRSVGHQRQARAAEVADDCQDAQPSPVGKASDTKFSNQRWFNACVPTARFPAATPLHLLFGVELPQLPIV